jgi:hypothetical protein
MGTGGKARPGRDADHSPSSSAEVKRVGAIPLPPKRDHGVDCYCRGIVFSWVSLVSLNLNSINQYLFEVRTEFLNNI